MLTVHEVSDRTGVSIRTLQYYDNIGLLRATTHTASGYRLYDDTALERLQQILLFRELQFPLKEIRNILSSPNFDREKAMRQQITLLELKKEQLEKLITLARKIIQTGDTAMDFSAFDKNKMEAYAQQARSQWGQTDAYSEYEGKRKCRTHAAEDTLGQGLMAIFRQMGAIKQQAPDSEAARVLVQQLQVYITENFYTCTGRILMSLGQMYAAGGEFTENIDAAGGPGTAEFANAAIQAYCK